VIHHLRTQVSQPWTQKRLWCGVLWNAVFLQFIPAALAQTTSSISGTVRDAADALLPGAKVTLINKASKATRTTTSNGEGFFDFAAVQPGAYSIQVSRTGFESWKVTASKCFPATASRSQRSSWPSER
jgi:hypothetical protein